MQQRFRRFAWLMLASAAIVSLAAGAVAAHEGRPVGDYRFIVGWLEEPTYEGGRNAISVRVNKVMEVVSQDGMSNTDHDGGHHGPVEAVSALSVEVEATIDPISCVNVHVMPSGFTFAPEKVNLGHVEGEGHAHIYVDGVKVSRVYTPWFHLDGLDPGAHEVEIRLNTNDHSEYTWNGEVVKASTQVTVPEAGDGMAHHGAATAAAESEMSVSIVVEPDPLGGANLYITDTTGFTFARQNASGENVTGEGHAHVYVNDVKVSRVYGTAFQLGKMAEGMNEVRVTLNANDHSALTWNGEPVQGGTTVHIAEGMGGAGYGTNGAGHRDTPEDVEHGHNGTENEDSGRLAPAVGAGKPLASLAGQAAEGGAAPVEGLADSLWVEVRHVTSGATRTLGLEEVAGDTGHYVAGLIPTAPGVYEFRVFGDIEGTAVDETFASVGGGGGFDDVRTPAELQFPVVLPEVREIESGVRGALQTAQQAEDAALAAQEGDGGSVLVIVALVAGIVGATLGAGGIFVGLRGRNS